MIDCAANFRERRLAMHKDEWMRQEARKARKRQRAIVEEAKRNAEETADGIRLKEENAVRGPFADVPMGADAKGGEP